MPTRSLRRLARRLVRGAPPPPPPAEPPPPYVASDGRVHAYDGRCACCGADGTFTLDGPHLRESFPCPACGALLREQAQAEAIVRQVTRTGSRCLAELVAEDAAQELAVFEPGHMGGLRPYLSTLPGYVASTFDPDRAPGSTDSEGRRNEDLMALTFPDASFDLVVTSDVFEHVRRADVGFAEVRRVLRPGGAHVFTVPAQHPLRGETVVRVDTSGDEDVPLLEEVRHFGILVYNDFGRDLVGRLDDLGFATEIVAFDAPDAIARRNLTFVSVAR